MMRYLFGFMCVCALGMLPLAGCSDPTDDSGMGGTGGNGGMGGISGPCSEQGVTCSCTDTNPSAPCNRVHLSNLNNQAGIMVELSTDDQKCTINELLVNTVELDQCVMNIGIGDEVLIRGIVAANPGEYATCVVDDTANVPGLEPELQTFASVFDQPVSIACETGFTM